MATVAEKSPPPPYEKVVRPQRPTPNITILLLGSPGVGKSTFLSALPRVRDGHLQANNVSHAQSPRCVPAIAPNPSSFAVSLYNRPYNIIIHRSESTLFVDPLPSKVDFAIFCYAVDSRESLYNCQYYWRKQFADRYERDLGLTVPIMLVGLKRDLRTDKMETVQGTAWVADVGGKEAETAAERRNGNGDQDKKEQYICVIPEEGLKAAQHMRCDRYAECSALTGELMWEILEDITRTAALTTTEKGGLSEGNCILM